MTRSRLNRRTAAVALAAVLAAALAMIAFAPDTGPGIAPTRALAALSPPVARPIAAARSIAAPAPPPVVDVDGPLAVPYDPDEGRHPLRLDAPGSPIDPDQTFSGDLRGLASAAVSRREAFVACRQAALNRMASDDADGYDPDAAGGARFLLQIVVDTEGHATADVLRGPEDAALAACVDEVIGTARFDPPETEQTMIWPVVTTGLRGEDGAD